MINTDIIVIGGGIAGLSAADGLAADRGVIILEGEDSVGFHASGRSATFCHFGIGNDLVRAMTRYSLDVFPDYDRPEDDVRVSWRWPAMFIATQAMRAEMDELEAVIAPLAPGLRRLDGGEAAAIVPVLRNDPDHIVAALLDPDARRLDSDALLQHHLRSCTRKGGRVITGAPVTSITRADSGWIVEAGGERYAATIVINAAGAWSDRIAGMAGVGPIGLQPLRRTIIVVDPPEGVDISAWPFTKTVSQGFYMLPDAGRLLVSPMDEEPNDPGDAQAEEYEIALAAWLLEESTTIGVRQVRHKWAGLRTFTTDRVPTAGFDRNAPGFFWLAGQGGYGLQTSPAMAAATASLILGKPWPEALTAMGVTAASIDPVKYR